MNILFVNNFRGRGGGEEFLYDLLPGLASRGMNVGLICRPGTPLVDMFKNGPVTVYPIPRSGLQGGSAILQTAKVVKQGVYEIIDITRGHDMIQTWLGATLSGRKPVLIYTPQVPEFMKSRFLLARMKHIITISRYIRDMMILYDPRIARRISIIYYGIDLQKFMPGVRGQGLLRSRAGLNPDTKIIGTVGALWKNQIEFLDAFVLIRKQVPDSRFAVTASERGSDLIEKFKRRAAELGLTEAILWTGRLSKQDMLSFYADIDIAISTHRNEGFGIWVLEALAVGTPVVSVNEGGIRDSLEGCPAGVLIDGGPKHMAAEVVRILKDSSLHARMAKAGPLWVAERFGKERMINDYYDFFRSLVRPEASGR